MNPKLQEKIELFLLSLLIILHITDFLEVLPGDLDFIKKIISWTALGYLFIKASLSTILFGHKKTKFDVSIILIYFLFITKDLIRYAQAAIEEAHLFEKLYMILIKNNVLIEKYSFYLGAILLLFIALYMAKKFEIIQPSFMAVLHETGPPPATLLKFLVRFISVYLTLISFFIIVFNLASEWLAIALDAPLAVIAILIYLFVIIRYHKNFHSEHFIHKIGHIGEDFYEKFIEMFHYKTTLYLGIMGILALHLLTDVGHFIIPYIIGLKDVLYFAHLGEGHTPLIYLLLKDITSAQLLGKIALAISYLFNTIAMIFLLMLPSFIWYRFFKGRQLHVSGTLLALIFPSLLCFVLTPAFFIKRIKVPGLAGVDIITQSILKSFSLLGLLIKDRITAIIIVVSISLLLGIIIWLLELNQRLKKEVFIIAVLTGLIFFGFYIFFYFTSLYLYYIETIKFLFKSSDILIAFYFILFAMITTIFYVGGYIFFIYEVFKRHFFSSTQEYPSQSQYPTQNQYTNQNQYQDYSTK